MARINKALFMAALDKGIQAAIDSINESLAAQEKATPEQQSFLPDVVSPVQKLIGFYVEEIQRKYGPKARPNLDGKAQGIVKRLLKTYTPSQVARLIRTYMEMTDKAFVDAGYSLFMLENKLQHVIIKATTGQDISGGPRGSSAALAEREQSCEEAKQKESGI